jgi:hydroxymethylpyrimidine/phosphomethylpyrimidine kinase
MSTPATPRILIVAGSDSGGGAGIQADIKTVTMLGGHAMTAITAITAQNTLGVQAVHAVPTDMVVAQLRSCIDDIGVDAVKIGMIGSAGTAHAVADVLEALNAGRPAVLRRRPGPSFTPPAIGSRPSPGNPTVSDGASVEQGRGKTGIPIVFDPVMVATSGSILADADTIAAFGRLMRIATLVTPNTPELAALAKREVLDEAQRGEAVAQLIDKHGCAAVLAKGGHLGSGSRVVDFLYDRDHNEARWDNPRIDTRDTHGTGCTLASAIATGLGEGMLLPAAIERAIHFVRASLEHAPGLGQGHGPMGQQFATGFRCPA